MFLQQTASNLHNNFYKPKREFNRLPSWPLSLIIWYFYIINLIALVKKSKFSSYWCWCSCFFLYSLAVLVQLCCFHTCVSNLCSLISEKCFQIEFIFPTGAYDHSPLVFSLLVCVWVGDGDSLYSMLGIRLARSSHRSNCPLRINWKLV